MYKIQVISHFENLWRFNICITCGGYDASGEQLYVVGESRITSEVYQVGFSPKLTAPDGYDPSEPLVLECDVADNIHAIVYFVPHVLPPTRSVKSHPPFAALVEVFRDGERVYSEEHEVNQWGGASININI